MTSIRKIARIAGVSHMTVSRALRNDPRVRAETRDRIVQLANEYHYKPITSQQTSARNGFLTIGCVVSAVGDEFYAEIIDGIVKRAFAESYHVVILQSSFDVNLTNQALLTLIEQQVKGVLLLSGIDPPPVSPEVLFELLSNDVVPIAIDKRATLRPIDLIWNDEEQMAALAVEYLLSLGHRHIAYLGIKCAGKHHYRYVIMHHALQAHGLSTEYCLEMPLTSPYSEPLDMLLQTSPSPTAIISFNDHVASRVIQTLSALGVRIPEDISVLGCGNMPMCDFLYPRLTSIDQHPREIGQRAVELLIQRIDSRLITPGDMIPLEVKVPSSLCERDSCGPPLVELYGVRR